MSPGPSFCVPSRGPPTELQPPAQVGLCPTRPGLLIAAPRPTPPHGGAPEFLSGLALVLGLLLLCLLGHLLSVLPSGEGEWCPETNSQLRIRPLKVAAESQSPFSTAGTKSFQQGKETLGGGAGGSSKRCQFQKAGAGGGWVGVSALAGSDHARQLSGCRRRPLCKAKGAGPAPLLPVQNPCTGPVTHDAKTCGGS